MPRIDIERLKRDMKITSDDSFLLEILFQESSRSVSNTRKQGALLVKDGAIIATGHFEAYKNIGQGKDKEKSSEVEIGSGAVENAIASCAKYGISVKGSILYTYFFPNAIVCKLIVKAGISEIKYVKQSDNPLGLTLCKESNVQVTQIKKNQ